jgi:hypothetical protein
MRVCPSCGFANSEDATKCALCGRALVPPEPPEHEESAPAAPPFPAEQAEPSAPVPPPPIHALPSPPAVNGRPPRNAYLRGLAFGSIPLLIFWILGGIAGYMQFVNPPNPYSYAGAGPFFAAVILGGIGLVIVLLATIGCLASRQTRFLGYGLLTMVLVSPVAAVLGCQIYVAALSTLPR